MKGAVHIDAEMYAKEKRRGISGIYRLTFETLVPQPPSWCEAFTNVLLLLRVLKQVCESLNLPTFQESRRLSETIVSESI